MQYSQNLPDFAPIAIETIKAAAEVLETIEPLKEAAKPFNGKVYNIRFNKAIQAATPANIWVSIKDNGRSVQIYNRNAYDLYLNAWNNENGFINESGRIDTAIFAEMLDRIETRTRAALYMWRDALANFVEYHEKLKTILEEVTRQMGTINPLFVEWRPNLFESSPQWDKVREERNNTNDPATDAAGITKNIEALQASRAAYLEHAARVAKYYEKQGPEAVKANQEDTARKVAQMDKATEILTNFANL